MQCWFSFSFPCFLNIYFSNWLPSSSLVDINLCSLLPIKIHREWNSVYFFHVWKWEVVVLRFNTSPSRLLTQDHDGPCPWSWFPVSFFEHFQNNQIKLCFFFYPMSQYDVHWFDSHSVNWPSVLVFFSLWLRVELICALQSNFLTSDGVLNA